MNIFRLLRFFRISFWSCAKGTSKALDLPEVKETLVFDSEL